MFNQVANIVATHVNVLVYDCWYTSSDSSLKNFTITAPVDNKFTREMLNEICTNVQNLFGHLKKSTIARKLDNIRWTLDIEECLDLQSDSYCEGLDLLFSFFVHPSNKGKMCRNFANIFYPKATQHVVYKIFVDFTSNKIQVQRKLKN